MSRINRIIFNETLKNGEIIMPFDTKVGMEKDKLLLKWLSFSDENSKSIEKINKYKDRDKNLTIEEKKSIYCYIKGVNIENLILNYFNNEEINELKNYISNLTLENAKKELNSYKQIGYENLSKEEEYKYYYIIQMVVEDQEENIQNYLDLEHKKSCYMHQYGAENAKKQYCR